MNSSAFCLLHEAKIKKEEDYHITSGQLVSYLERALMFN